MRRSPGKTFRSIGQPMPLARRGAVPMQRARLTSKVIAALTAVLLAESSVLVVTAVAGSLAAVLTDEFAGAEARMLQAQTAVRAVVKTIGD